MPPPVPHTAMASEEHQKGVKERRSREDENWGGARNTLSSGKMSTTSNVEKKNQWSLVSIFLMCLLACFITTAIGVLILSLVYVNNSQLRVNAQLEPEAWPLRTTAVPKRPKEVDPKFQFLNHLPKSKVFEFAGGAIQWARYRNHVEDYLSGEEEAFGTSLNTWKSQMTLGTLRIKSNGLRAPHWHFNANEHGYLVQGTAWIGVVDDGGEVATTYNVTAGQVIFFPTNTLHWIKNAGDEDCFFLLFFSTHDELQTLDVDDVFFSTPEDIVSRSLKPEGGIDFIRKFPKQTEDQGVNLPPNLAELVMNASYVQSPDNLVWRYFFDLKGSKQYQFPGGVIQKSQFWKNENELSNNENIFSEFLNQHQNALTLSTLRIYNNGLRQPHFHFNANEMGYVLSGCGKVGIVSAQRTIEFEINIGDVLFFPVGTQHYIKSTCDEDLLLVLAFSTGDKLQTLDMDDYIQATADHILAQLFFKKQSEFKKIPKFSEDQAINLP
ncbi:dynactin-associated protein [Ctenodactylus gundi]